MHIGKGTLILRDGRKLPLEYQFGSDYGDTRAGYLLCNTADLDPGVLCDRLSVTCDDGTDLVMAVMHFSDKYLAVTGRVLHADRLNEKSPAPPKRDRAESFQLQRREYAAGSA